MDDLRRRREFYNTQVNRYARDHATNIIAHPNPGSKYAMCRTLAKAVIYQALKDAVEETAMQRREKFMLLNDSRWKLLHTYVNPEANIQRLLFENIGNGRIYEWTSNPPEAVRFFTSQDYIFYSGIAGIQMDGPHLLKRFMEKHRYREHIPSVDQVID